VKGGCVVTAKDAVARRIQVLCVENGLAVNGLADQCGISPSTVYSILGEKSKNPGVNTVQQICDGLNMSVREFFDDPLFENLEPIIQ